MLKITSDGRKLGLDQRIINPDLPDEQGTKINICVENILRIWRDGEAEKLTQLVFCDISTPKAKASDRDSEDRDDTDRPSVLDDLHRRVEEMPPHRRTESRELEERA